MSQHQALAKRLRDLCALFDADLAPGLVAAALEAATVLDEQHYADAEHEHLGCHVAKTGIYAAPSATSHDGSAEGKEALALLQKHSAPSSVVPPGALDMSPEARLKDAEDDVLRLHNEKMKFFERTIELERELAEAKVSINQLQVAYDDAEASCTVFAEREAARSSIGLTQEQIESVRRRNLICNGPSSGFTNWAKEHDQTLNAICDFALSATVTPDAGAELESAIIYANECRADNISDFCDALRVYFSRADGKADAK